MTGERDLKILSRSLSPGFIEVDVLEKVNWKFASLQGGLVLGKHKKRFHVKLIDELNLWSGLFVLLRPFALRDSCLQPSVNPGLKQNFSSLWLFFRIRISV